MWYRERLCKAWLERDVPSSEVVRVGCMLADIPEEEQGEIREQIAAEWEAKYPIKERMPTPED